MIVIYRKILRWQPELIPECGLTKSSIIICIVVCSDVLYLSNILITINWISRHIICKTWWRLTNSLWTRGI